MSWRVFFHPYPPWESETLPGRILTAEECGDWTVPSDATQEQVHEIADKAAWKQPLKLFSKEENQRLRWFTEYLEYEYCMSAEDYSIIIT